MKLSLNSTYDQIYDLTYKGTLYAKESFLCVSIDDQKFKPDPLQDEFSQFQTYLLEKIIPALNKIIDQSLNKNALKTKYVIHDVGGEQGQIHPHIIIRRDDFNLLSKKDRLNIENLMINAIEQINQKPQKNVRFDLNNSFFTESDKKVQDSISQTHRTSPSLTN